MTMTVPLQSVALVAGLLAALTAPASAEQATLGRVTFEIPPGWERQDSSTGLLLSRAFDKTADTGQAAAMIQLIAIDQGPAALEANVATMVGTMPEFVGEDTMTDSSGSTVNGHAIRVEYRCCQYKQDISMGQTVAGVADDDAQLVATMIFMNVSSDHEQTADADFEALVRSIRFAGDANDGLAPVDGDGGLEGVYTHLSTGLMPNVFGGMDFNVDNEITLFDKAGLFTHALPTNGQTIAEHCAASPRDCGTYRLNGGGWLSAPSEIEMRSVVDDYGVIETEKRSFGRDGDNLVIDEGDYRRLPAFDDGTTLDGSWTYTWASSGMTATGSGGVATQRTLELHPDGRFERDGWAGGGTSGQLGGVTVSSTRPSDAGTYHIAGYELVLTGADGTKEALSLFAPDIGSDELLVIDGANYLKDGS
jgi:hypothetical protein